MSKIKEKVKKQGTEKREEVSMSETVGRRMMSRRRMQDKSMRATTENRRTQSECRLEQLFHIVGKRKGVGEEQPMPPIRGEVPEQRKDHMKETVADQASFSD